MIRSGFEPETHSLEGCCSIQLSYQTSSECARKKKLAPRVWLAAIPPLTPNSRSLGYFFAVFDRLEDSFLNAYARKTTYAGTAISAYKGNLGAKVLLFFELCK